MRKDYIFISIQNVVKIYQSTEDMVQEIPSAVKYSMEQEEFWTWFENNVGDFEGHNAFFFADEILPIPMTLLSTEITYSPQRLKAILKPLFPETAVTVQSEEALPFTLHSEEKETQSLHLLYPLEAVEQEQEEESEVVLEEMPMDTGEKSDVKKAFEVIFEGYQTH